MTEQPIEANPANRANQTQELASLADLAGDARPPARGPNGRFLTGNSGGGRPRGSRNRLTDVFLSAIADDFAEHGAEAIARIRKEDPATYLRIVSSLVPRELVAQRESEPAFDLDSLSFSDLIILLEQARQRETMRRALIQAEPSAQVVPKRR